MAASLAPRLTVFVLLLALSIGLKLTASSRSIRDAEQTVTTADRAVAAFLDRQGFRTVIGGQPDFRFVSAVAGECRLTAVLAAHQGWHRSVIHQIATAQDQVLFVFGAALYQDQPVWLTWSSHYWRALNLYLGRRLPAQPVLGIVASSSCAPRDMPWSELAEFL